MEAIRLTKSFSILHGRARDFLEYYDLGNHLKSLYAIVFGKDAQFVEGLMQWHSSFPFRTDYFMAMEKDEPVAFNYFLSLPDANDVYYSLSGGSLTHPNSRGSFQSLFQVACGEMLKKTSTLYGFCNQYSYPIFVHPVNKWKPVGTFRQQKIISPRRSNRNNGRYLPVHSSELNVELRSLTRFNRSYDFLNWRLSRNERYQIIRNLDTSIVAIYKEFGNEVDLLCLLNCSNINQYFDEITNLLFLFPTKIPSFQGLNIFHSFHADEQINRLFIAEPLQYSRFLCFRNISADVPENFHAEMIDTDTF
jgi:hypothetical protein